MLVTAPSFHGLEGVFNQPFCWPSAGLPVGERVVVLSELGLGPRWFGLLHNRFTVRSFLLGTVPQAIPKVGQFGKEGTDPRSNPVTVFDGEIQNDQANDEPQDELEKTG